MCVYIYHMYNIKKYKTMTKKVNFLDERKPYIRNGTAQAVLKKDCPTAEKYSLCGPGCKSCTCSCTGGKSCTSWSSGDGGGDSND